MLDDYFDDQDKLDVMSPINLDAMASSHNSGETSQLSMRSVNDSLKQTHTLYDDADTARRNILRLAEPVTFPPSVVTKEPPATAVTMPSFVREPASDVCPDPDIPKRSNTNPFRHGMTAIGRSFGVGVGPRNRDLAEEGRSREYVGDSAHNLGTTAGKQLPTPFPTDIDINQIHQGDTPPSATVAARTRISSLARMTIVSRTHSTSPSARTI